MRLRQLLICALAGFWGLVPVSIFAQRKPITISVVTTFDYPGAGNSTTPFGINGNGDIAGDYLDTSNVRRGFVRFSDGSFSPPIVAPNDTGNFTRARGINNAQTVTGDFFTVAGNAFHGYFLNGGVFTQFDFGGPFSTGVFGINDGGDFVGAFGSNAQPNQAFVNIGGTSTVISIPGAFDSQALGINNSDQVVGVFRDSGLTEHGFFRDSDGTLTAPIDFPGSTATALLGINGRGWIVGRYTDGSGQVHGLFLNMPNTFVSFDFPNATGTSLNGINQAGFISGRDTDSSGIRHGFVARVKFVPKQ